MRKERKIHSDDIADIAKYLDNHAFDWSGNRNLL